MSHDVLFAADFWLVLFLEDLKLRDLTDALMVLSLVENHHALENP